MARIYVEVTRYAVIHQDHTTVLVQAGMNRLLKMARTAQTSTNVSVLHTAAHSTATIQSDPTTARVILGFPTHRHVVYACLLLAMETPVKRTLSVHQPRVGIILALAKVASMARMGPIAWI